MRVDKLGEGVRPHHLTSLRWGEAFCSLPQRGRVGVGVYGTRLANSAVFGVRSSIIAPNQDH
jgi:hypothetical protein